jgi:hypothetical protein
MDKYSFRFWSTFGTRIKIPNHIESCNEFEDWIDQLIKVRYGEDGIRLEKIFINKNSQFSSCYARMNPLPIRYTSTKKPIYTYINKDLLIIRFYNDILNGTKNSNVYLVDHQ